MATARGRLWLPLLCVLPAAAIGAHPNSSTDVGSNSSAPDKVRKDGCQKYDPLKDCQWTLEWSCPGQPVGTKGVSKPVQTSGFRCCCEAGLWRNAKIASATSTAVPNATMVPTRVRPAEAQPAAVATDTVGPADDLQEVSMGPVFGNAGGDAEVHVHSSKSRRAELNPNAPASSVATPSPRREGKPIPVIIDTDIGDDFDDSWALAFALSDPRRWDVLMILTSMTDTTVRAKLVAKYLTRFGRMDVPIGIGVAREGPVGSLKPWAEDVDLQAYNKTSGGRVCPDGVRAAAELLEAAEEPITIIALAPQTNLRELGLRFPTAVRKIRSVYAMMGALDLCYEGKPIVKPGSCPEYNIAKDPVAAQEILAGPSRLRIVTLDTCSLRFRGKPWERMNDAAAHGHFMAKTLIETLRLWGGGSYPPGVQRSDVIYDTAAVYMVHSMDLWEMENVSLVISESGAMTRAQGGYHADVATAWMPHGEQTLMEEVVDTILNAVNPGYTMFSRSEVDAGSLVDEVDNFHRVQFTFRPLQFIFSICLCLALILTCSRNRSLRPGYPSSIGLLPYSSIHD